MPSKNYNSSTRREIFSNPFAMSSKTTRRQLDKFYDSDDDDHDGFEEISYDVEGGSGRAAAGVDGSGAYAPVATKGLLAQDVLRDDRYYHDGAGDDDGEGGDSRNDLHYPKRQKRKRDRRVDEIITMPSSFNTIWIYVLILITAFGLAWYGLSKEEVRNEKMQAALELEAAAKENPVTVTSTANSSKGEDFHNDTGEENATSNTIPIHTSEEIQTKNANPKTAQVRPPPPSTFDPFQLFESQKEQQQLNFHTNEWYGAPFVVSPPRLPDVLIDRDGLAGPGTNGDENGGSASRLGYLQYPTIVNGTLVFSSEGDLYLTRLDDGRGNDSGMYPAMKLTTTVGNAIHPKLNPQYPHLLAYSATYSGTREVYLMDLRAIALSHHRDDTGGGAPPGSPGGPALRLTYTPGGIRSVEGWSDDGTSILYSAVSADVALPDVRLFRLRLTSGVGMDVGPVNGGSHGDGVEGMNAKNQEKVAAASSKDQNISSSGNGGGQEPQSTAPSGGDSEVESGEQPLSSDSVESTVDDDDDDDNDDDDDDDDDDNSVDQVDDANETLSDINFSKQENIENAGVTSDKTDEDKENKESSEVKSSSVINPEDKTAAGQERDDDDDDDDATDHIADAKAYVEKMAPEIPNSPPNEESEGEQAGGEHNANPNTNHNTRQRRLYREERHRRHLAKLSSRSAQAKRGAMGSPESPILPIIEAVPLAQSTEGVYHSISSSSSSSQASECIYFTRFKQSSSTKRYVGGTAESIWAYCAGKFDDMAIPLTEDYNGTSKSPSVYYNYDDFDLILFMSDRAFLSDSTDGTTGDEVWTAGSMDLWAARLPVKASGLIDTPIRLTSVSCEHNGLDLSEYSVDPISGAIILRIGADLHYMTKETIATKISINANEEKRNLDNTKTIPGTQQLPIAVYSDFSNMQERLLPLSVVNHLSTIDAYATSYGTISTLLTARGQTFVAPVIPDTKNIPQSPYGGGGRNMPARRYKVAPGSGGGGIVRILTAKHIPNPLKSSQDSGERHALVLATDPLSPTAEHAFYIVRTDAMASPAFGFASLYDYGDSVADTGLPAPFIGGHLESGGSTEEGGLGSVYGSTVTVSPCGRRVVWTNTDGQIVTVTLPKDPVGEVNVVILPQQNEIGQPMVGDSETELIFSPGGRYLAITHPARNQFKVISIADLGVPEDGVISVGRIVQATTDRFNSFSPVWGKQSKDFLVDKVTTTLDPSASSAGATALFFLSDRDVVLSGPSSPWGTRAPSPSFSGEKYVYTLPLQSLKDSLSFNEVNAFIRAPYGGGGAMEVSMEGIKELDVILELIASSPAIVPIDGNQTVINSTTSTALLDQSHLSSENDVENLDNKPTNSSEASDDGHQFIVDTPISFGPEKDVSLSFARTSFRIDSIPSGDYVLIVSQLLNDPSLVVVSSTPTGFVVNIFATSDYPSDGIESVSVEGASLDFIERSTDGNYLITLFSTGLKVSSLTADGITAFMQDASFDKNIADAEGLHLSIWPALEYEMMYKDAWRMLRDYFYDPSMAGLEWDRIFDRYLPLVERCSKREELDDVLRQMAGELSALHVFVYGGEYNIPNHGDPMLEAINEIASLGALLRRSTEKFGYEVVKIPEIDPDFHMVDGLPMYSPLSSQTLRMSGQDGLAPGDVIVGVNGESVMSVPDINMLLRNVAGESVRLEVVRLNSTSKLQEARKLKARLLESQGDNATESVFALPEPLIVVPIDSEANSNLWYTAWEWKTRETARQLAADAGFTLGYIHLRDMAGAPAEDAFVRGFYPDYDKEALIVDVRNNHGGNIDSWLLDVLQKRAWMYWEGRSTNITNGGLGWDEQFAFRGHLVVLVNEHTSSDGEAFARGVSELGLGKIVGKRTWGGGIWLSSDNHLVDGGIATAPEIGVYNEHIGLGLKIENMGVVPDVEVDNNPRAAFDGVDTQLERAIEVLKDWLEKEPIVLPERGPYADLSLRRGVDDCSL